MRGIPKNNLRRTTISLEGTTYRRLDELMRILKISRSEVISYLVEREHERRVAEVHRVRQIAVIRGGVETALVKETDHE